MAELTTEDRKKISEEMKLIKKKRIQTPSGIDIIQLKTYGLRYNVAQIKELRENRLQVMQAELHDFISQDAKTIRDAGYNNLANLAVAAAKRIYEATKGLLTTQISQSGDTMVTFGKDCYISKLISNSSYKKCGDSIIDIGIALYLQRYSATTYTKALNAHAKEQNGEPPVYKEATEKQRKMKVGLRFEDDGVDELFTSSKSLKANRNSFFSTILSTTSNEIYSFFTKEFRVGTAPLIKLKIIPLSIFSSITYALEDVHDFDRKKPFLGNFSSSKSKIKIKLNKSKPDIFSNDYTGSITFIGNSTNDEEYEFYTKPEMEEEN